MPDSGLVRGNAINQVDAKRPHTRSRFDMSYHMYDTMRFGELHPHFVMEAVKSDRIRLRSAHDVRSFSLKAPLMSKIQLKKDYFAVPMEAILPFNWDKVYCNPPLGDDVPSDVGTYVPDFTSSIHFYLSSYVTIFNNSSLTDIVRMDAFMHFLIIGEGILSDGSLAASLGIHLNSIFTAFNAASGVGNKGFDDYVSGMFSRIVSSAVSFRVQIGSEFYSFLGSTAGQNVSVVNDFHVFTELLRDNWDFQVTLVDSSKFTALVNSIGALNFGYRNPAFVDFGLDLKRLWAYQLVCAHFYSNDHVDFIYSAELFRELISSYIDNLAGVDVFSYNGISTYFDYLSAHYFISTLHYIANSFTNSYLQAIFGYKHSLRFVDYFVGAKTRPLAVGDVNVDVHPGSPNYVNIIDVTRRTQAQRFYNAVNISGRKFSNYLNELFPGGKPAPDYHNPFYIGHTADDIYGQEVENTNVIDQESAKQGLSVISNLRSNGSRFEFNFECDRPSILLGISYFDVPRSYWSTIEKQNFAKDRFDMFNPYMQFIGDQEISENELCAVKNSTPVFGYTGRHMEYKQRYNQCAGGFVSHLPGYTFLNDRAWELDLYYQSPTIGPSFIRSKSYELDRFYISLTGFALCDYFHFIVDTYNDVSASRPMAYNPQIL